VTGAWTDPAVAQDWARGDGQGPLLALPRRLAAEVVAADRPGTRRIADIGSGPGEFLRVFLDRFPGSHGVWSDISAPMQAMAEQELAGFDGRVRYLIADMLDFSGLPPDVDVIITSRATHHLSGPDLRAFYREAAGRLAPGGWLVNLDHTGLDPVWDERVRAARKLLVPRTGEQRSHRHDHPLSPAADHLAALAEAGLGDVDTPWRAFMTTLFMARRNG
jgi:SAM-dependent methyltransferase